MTERIEIPVGSLTFDARADGPADGDLVVLLHGFPQNSSSWDGVIGPLARRGYRAVAPDQRGYSPRARPQGVAAYSTDRLAGDVVAMAQRLGADRFHLVGHDWGGAVAWTLAARRPELLHTLAVVSTPHPAALLHALLTSSQLLRSLYMPLFALPGVPETILGARDNAGLRLMLTRSGLPAARAAEYARALAQPGALTAALNWYRAMRPWGMRQVGPSRVPTLYVWSTGDTALGRAAAEATARHVAAPYRFEVLEGVSHWVSEERPEQLSRLLIEHLEEQRPA